MSANSDNKKESKQLNNKTFASIAVLVVVVITVVIAIVFFNRSNTAREEQEQALQEQMNSATQQPGLESEETAPTAPSRRTTTTTQTAPASPTAASPSESKRSGKVNGNTPLQGSSEEEVIDFSRNFATKFLGGFTSDEEMRAQLTPVMTPELSQQFETVSYRNMPYDEVGDVSIFSQGTSDALVDINMKNNNQVLRVYVVRSNNEWKVSDYGIR